MTAQKFLAFTTVAVFALLASSCLKCEKKTYTWNFTGPNSGTLTVKYVNILSEVDYEDEENTPDDQITADYNDLISRFIEGTEAEDDFPDAKFVSKRLFEQDGSLCGEIVFEFTDISQAKLFKYDKTAPLMYYSSDSVLYTDGNRGPSYMPVVMWENNANKIVVTNHISTAEGESLLSMWKESKKEKPMGN